MFSITKENPATNSVPVPPPFPRSGLSLKMFTLRDAENKAWAAGVPRDISARELHEADERIKAVEEVIKKQREKESIKESKEIDLKQSKDKIKIMEKNIKDMENKLKNIENKLEEQIEINDTMPDSSKKKLEQAITKKLKVLFEDLRNQTYNLEKEKSELKKLNNTCERQEQELNEAVEEIDRAAKKVLEAEAKLMPADKEKSNLFNAKKVVNHNDKPEKSDDTETKDFENFLVLFREKKRIKDDIKKIEASGCDGGAIKLKESLQSKELDCQYALRSGLSAVIYALNNKKEPLKKITPEKTGAKGFFQTPNANTIGSEDAASKDAMKTVLS